MTKRAILLSGGVNPRWDYPRYGNDLGFAYKVLTECCNYKSEDITVLYSFGKKIIYNGMEISTHIASKENLEAELNKAVEQLESSDEFVLIVSNHGDGVKNGLINLWNQNEFLFDELASRLSHIKAKKLIVLGECYSGNFIRHDILNCCIVAGNEKGKCTYVHPQNMEYDEFLYNFLSFLYGEYPDTKKKIDGAEVNIKKAFEFALQNDAFNPNNPCYFSGYNKNGKVYIEIPQICCNDINLHELLQ